MRLIVTSEMPTSLVELLDKPVEGPCVLSMVHNRVFDAT